MSAAKRRKGPYAGTRSKPKRIYIQIGFDEDVWQWMQQEGARQGVTASQLVREVVDQYQEGHPFPCLVEDPSKLPRPNGYGRPRKVGS